MKMNKFMLKMMLKMMLHPMAYTCRDTNKLLLDYVERTLAPEKRRKLPTVLHALRPGVCVGVEAE